MAFSCTVVSTMTRWKSFGLAAVHCHGRLDGGLEQLFDAGLTECAPQAADLGGVTGLFGLVEGHATEELPVDVLAPAFTKRLVALVEGVLQVQQRDHQAHGQTGPACRADTGPGDPHGLAEQVGAFHRASGAILVGEYRRQRLFDYVPWHASGQNGQRMTQLDHAVQPRAEEVVCAHQRGLANSQELHSIAMESESSRHRH